MNRGDGRRGGGVRVGGGEVKGCGVRIEWSEGGQEKGVGRCEDMVREKR